LAQSSPASRFSSTLGVQIQAQPNGHDYFDQRPDIQVQVHLDACLEPSSDLAVQMIQVQGSTGAAALAHRFILVYKVLGASGVR
jgi:hypothetical protein